MDHKILFTKKQVLFLQEWTEEKNLEEAVQVFIKCMISEQLDPSDILIVLDKVIKRIERLKK